MSEIEIVRVTPARSPLLEGRCRRCDRRRRFLPTGLFRANTNGRLADIWLVYRCERCDGSRNVAVVERVAVGRLPQGLLAAAQANDPALARRFARDPAIVRGVTSSTGRRRTAGGPRARASPPRPARAVAASACQRAG